MTALVKTPPHKTRKQTIEQILRKAYTGLCRDKATRHALRQHLKTDPTGRIKRRGKLVRVCAFSLPVFMSSLSLR